MSWKRSGTLVSGPPTLSGRAEGGQGSSERLVDRLKPNGAGLSAFQRERQVVGRYGDAYASGSGAQEERRTEWDVLKENHRFIRDDEDSGEVTWEERLARAYESKLFKEFALIDLKHYKSKRLALRWRTAPEVVEGIGEDTCGSLRCRHHRPTPPEDDWTDDEWDSRDRDRDGRRMKKRRKEKPPPALRAFELPFVYEEAGVRKEALVKVKLCSRCEGKLKWKPPVEEDRRAADSESDEEDEEDRASRRKRHHKEDDGDGRGGRDERVAARSRSPISDRRRREEELYPDSRRRRDK